MIDGGVRFDGLRELDRALGRTNKDLRTVLRRDLKEVAEVVAVEARQIAQQKGLVRSGDLVRMIQPYALVRGAGVRSSALHRGYRYPRRLEYEGRDGGAYGPDATVLPAVEHKQAELYAKAEELLDKLMVDLST
ncbi:MAG TPA: hypothetical protein VN803_13030 [Gemmatimonadales bacterium]|nr:hypothetical protein [Gemmatimonadales bacterium]